MLSDKDKKEYRSQQFNYFRENIPTTGDILVAIEGISEAKIHTSTKDGKTTKFVNACIDADATGWYLSNGDRGLKCLITPQDHEKLGESVRKLSVLRQADTGKYLICKVID